MPLFRNFSFRRIALFAGCVLLFSFFVPGETEFASVKIGEDEWMTTNLDVSTFRNGDPIPQAQTRVEWEKASRDSAPAWCYYENDSANGKRYGRLYNWYAVRDPRGLAPKGWHIASQREWQSTIDLVGGKWKAGNVLKSKEGWTDKNKSTDSLGLQLAPGGFRSKEGFFSNAGGYGFYWTCSYADSTSAFAAFAGSSATVIIGFEAWGSGQSCRCIKTKP